jgi:hypothetical protein
MFHRDLRALTDAQLAAVISYTRGPGYLDEHPDVHGRISRQLLQGVKGDL